MSDELVSGQSSREACDSPVGTVASCDCLNPFCDHWIQGRDSFRLVRLHEKDGGVYERCEWVLGEFTRREDLSMRVGLFDCARREHEGVLQALGGAAKSLGFLVKNSRAREVYDELSRFFGRHDGGISSALTSRAASRRGLLLLQRLIDGEHSLEPEAR